MTLLHELVEATVDRQPDAQALCTDSVVWTYAELDDAANRIAGRLRRSGTGVGDLVAVALPTSPLSIAAILGVLKAGAAYLPVDPDHPDARVGFVLDDSAAALVITDEASAARFASFATPVVTVEALRDWPPDPRPVADDVAPTDLAYVIYTSGSTGRPKGVAVEHRQIVASIRSRPAHYERAPETFALLFPPAFDGAVGTIYWTLMAGGCLYLPPSVADGRADELLWAGGVGRQVTDICCVPSLYQFILEHAEPSLLSGLRRVIVAAEACRPSVTERHFALAPQASLHNEYGPTEAAVWSTVHDCPGPVTGTVPIGRPITAATVAILDEGLRPVPDGALGELVIGGEGVARGYLNAEEETAKRFLPDPSAPGRRRYRTGDLVRRRADGELEFVGRNDDQISLRGYRIEPGEVEAGLGSFPGVVDVAVVLNTSVAEQPALVAFVRTDGVTRLDPAGLSAHLRDRLPEFMVPTGYVEVDALPRTDNGKVDRDALAGRAWTESDPSHGDLSDLDDLEERIRRVVSGVLQTPDVSPDAHFFRLGANSISFMRIAAAAGQQGIALSVKDVFRAPTVLRLAELLRSRSGSGAR